jgi:prepilin-type N-terminal cleavage/methylation domain-containing protein
MFLQSNQQVRDLRPRARGHRDRAQAGAFTFIEVLAVVLILGIASAIVMPQFTSRDDLDAQSAARAVMADLLYAQDRAIATQQPQYVVFNVSSQSYSLYSGSFSGPTTLLTHPVNLNKYVMTFGQTGSNNISSDVTLGAVSFNTQNTVAFDEMGTPYAYSSGTTSQLTQPGTIVLNCGLYSLTISVTQDTGEITVN